LNLSQAISQSAYYFLIPIFIRTRPGRKSLGSTWWIRVWKSDIPSHIFISTNEVVGLGNMNDRFSRGVILISPTLIVPIPPTPPICSLPGVHSWLWVFSGAYNSCLKHFSSQKREVCRAIDQTTFLYKVAITWGSSRTCLPEWPWKYALRVVFGGVCCGWTLVWD